MQNKNIINLRKINVAPTLVFIQVFLNLQVSNKKTNYIRQFSLIKQLKVQ